MSCLSNPTTTTTPPASYDLSNLTSAQKQQLNCGGWDVGDRLNVSQLETVWSSNGCSSIFNTMTFPGGTYNLNGFQTAQQLMSNALWTYFTKNPFEPSIYNSPVMQSQLLEACSTVPGLCSLSQNTMCSSCSRDQISSSYTLLQFCGCFAPEDPLNPANLNPSCDSLCTNSLSSKNRSLATGEPDQCNQAVCVIDNVSVNATASSLKNVNFTQVCTQCSSDTSGCQCYINVGIPNIIEQMGLDGPTLEQECPYNQCFIINDVSGEIKQVKCSDYNKFDTSKPINKNWYWILGFLFFIIVFAIFSYTFWSNNYTQVSFELYQNVRSGVSNIDYENPI